MKALNDVLNDSVIIERELKKFSKTQLQLIKRLINAEIKTRKKTTANKGDKQ